MWPFLNTIKQIFFRNNQKSLRLLEKIILLPPEVKKIRNKVKYIFKKQLPEHKRKVKKVIMYDKNSIRLKKKIINRLSPSSCWDCGPIPKPYTQIVHYVQIYFNQNGHKIPKSTSRIDA